MTSRFDLIEVGCETSSFNNVSKSNLGIGVTENMGEYGVCAFTNT